MHKRFSYRKSVTATLVALGVLAGTVPAVATAGEAEIMKRIDALQAEIAALKAEMAARPAVAAATGAAAAAAPASVAKSAPSVSAPAKAAAPAVEIYGRVEMALELNDDGALKRTLFQNYSSRIGFKGQRGFGNDITGIFQMETGFAPDDTANSKTLANRNSFLGLKGSWGTAIVGTFDTPFKKLEDNLIILGANADVAEHILHGKAVSGPIGANFHTRAKNTLQYWSPKISGFQAKIAYSPDELKPQSTTVAGNGLQPDKTLRGNLGTSLEYSAGSWNVGVATDSKADYAVTGKNIDAIKVIGGLKGPAWSVGAGVSTIDNGAGRKSDAWMVSGQYDLNFVLLKFNYGVAGQTASAAADGGRMVGVGADYAVDKATTAYVFYSKFDADSLSKGFKLDAGDTAFKTLTNGASATAAGVGLRYNF